MKTRKLGNQRLAVSEIGLGCMGMDHNQRLLDLIEQIPESKNITSAQAVLAWKLAQKPYIVPIPGTTKLHRLEENLGTSSAQLIQEELASINEALSKIDIDETHF